jgi:hypothetical protein
LNSVHWNAVETDWRHTQFFEESKSLVDSEWYVDCTYIKLNVYGRLLQVHQILRDMNVEWKHAVPGPVSAHELLHLPESFTLDDMSQCSFMDVIHVWGSRDLCI